MWMKHEADSTRKATFLDSPASAVDNGPREAPGQAVKKSDDGTVMGGV